jgi:hypothetical protein
MRQRIKNILREFIRSGELYSKHSPRMTDAEMNELWDLGLRLQKSSCHGADTSQGYVYYPLHDARDFKAKAIALLENNDDGRRHNER